MSTKTVDIPEVGRVQLSKRRSNRSIRISITAKGEVRVTLPQWAPYKTAIDFVKSRQNWITIHRPAPRALLKQGDRIGKAHVLHFLRANQAAITTRIQGNQIRIYYPIQYQFTDEPVQLAAQKGAIRALRSQAKHLLPVRLQELARRHNFTYKSVAIKQLTSRWGSCSNKQEIVLNLFLVQLDWQLIDYVLLHELVHTQALNHGEKFWGLFTGCLPHARDLRKIIKQQQPVLQVQA